MGFAGPQDTGSPTEESDGVGEQADPLAELCAQLNFAHSLVQDAHRLRGSVVDVLRTVAATRAQNAAAWARCAERRREPSAVRYRAMAASTRDLLDFALVRAARVGALRIGEPRSS